MYFAVIIAVEAVLTEMGKNSVKCYFIDSPVEKVNRCNLIIYLHVPAVEDD